MFSCLITVKIILSPYIVLEKIMPNLFKNFLPKTPVSYILLASVSYHDNVLTAVEHPLRKAWDIREVYYRR